MLIAAILACSPARAGGIDPDNPPHGLFNDEWVEIYMGGKKTGYAHSTMRRENDLIHTNTDMRMRIGRAGQMVELRIIQGTTETVAGGARSFETTMDLSVMKTTTKGTIRDDKVTIVSSQYGNDQTQVFEFPAGALMTWGLFRETLRRGFAPGTEYTLQVYAPELRMDGAVTLQSSVGEWEEFQHRGKTLAGRKITSVLELAFGSLTTLSWVDKDGQPLKVLTPMPGLGEMEIITTDQATALEDFVAPEIFMTTVVKAHRSIDRRRARRIRYRLVAREAGAELGDLPTTGMQTLGKQTDGSVEVVVVRLPRTPGAGAPGAGGAAKNPLPQLAEYLEGNLMINVHDPKLIELGKQAAGRETEPYALADSLRRFVTGYVANKSMNIGFATASEVARTKEGDCSEHGVLLAALARLNGLPSRVVVGLAYTPFFGGAKDIFGYHLWTQLWINGRWVDYDAALGESDCSPARIAFATSSLKNTGLADLSFALLSKIGAIDLDILEIESTPPD